MFQNFNELEGYKSINTQEEIKKSCLAHLNRFAFLKVLGFVFGILGLIFLVILLDTSNRGDINYQNILETCLRYVDAIPFVMGILVLGVLYLIFALFPKLTPAYRVLEKEQLFHEFHEEVVRNYSPHKIQVITPSFKLFSILSLSILEVTDQSKLLKNKVKVKNDFITDVRKESSQDLAQKIYEDEGFTGNTLRSEKTKNKKRKLGYLIFIPIILNNIGSELNGIEEYYLGFAAGIIMLVVLLIYLIHYKSKIAKATVFFFLISCCLFTRSHYYDIPFIEEPAVVYLDNLIFTNEGGLMDNTYSLQGNTEENREYTFYVSENVYNEIIKDLENDDRYIINYLPNTRILIGYSKDLNYLKDNPAFMEFLELNKKYGSGSQEDEE